MVRTKEQNLKIRNTKKAIILQAAIQCFNNKGYYGSSMSIIAKTAGISKSLLYHYFETKEALVREIFQYSSQIIDDHRNIYSKQLNTHNDLEQYIRLSFQSVRDNIELYKLMFTIIYIPDVYNMVHNEINDRINKNHNILYNYFKMNFDNPELIFKTYNIMFRGLVTSYCISNGTLDEKIINHTIEQILIITRK